MSERRELSDVQSQQLYPLGRGGHGSRFFSKIAVAVKLEPRFLIYKGNIRSHAVP
jgi:hypothetical protein